MLDLMGFNNKNDNNSKKQQASESTRLLTAPSNASGDKAVANGGNNNGQQKEFYFLSKGKSFKEGSAPQPREVVEGIPAGSTTDEFAPKHLPPIPAMPPVNSPHANKHKKVTMTEPEKNVSNGAGNGVANPGSGVANPGNAVSNAGNAVTGFINNFFHPLKKHPSQRVPNIIPSDAVGSMVKPRKAPIKVEPKVFFANERTFLAWMHLSVTLAGASIAILAFAEDHNPVSQLYGVLLLPVAIAFVLYSMYQYARRSYMLRTRHPGPYEDTIGPSVLGIMLMVSIVAQFALKLYTMAH